jgi:hypothetical protein
MKVSALCLVILCLAMTALVVAAPKGVALPPGSAPSRDAASMQVVRSQMHALNSRLYADVGAQLGLTRDEASKLIDLLTDQQVDRLKGERDIADSSAQSAIADLLGGANAAALAEYQKTLPERHELLAIAGQLEGAGVALTAQQSTRLLAVLADERQRIPEPAPDSTPVESTQEFNDWQAGHTERVATQARVILSSSQWAVFESYQRELTEQRERLNSLSSRPGQPGAPVNYTDADPVQNPH